MSRYQRNRSQREASAERLTGLMRARGISSAALADGVRIQRSTLDNFCAGGPSLPSDVMERIARELQTTARYLAGEEEALQSHIDP
jgi:transcriptional regulator with XRE-family HTH domain